jgi:cbb3-type cytochrome oxidase maturation protein
VETIFVLLPLALLIAAIAVCLFIWAARSGQFDDLDTPAVRILFDDEAPRPASARDTSAPVRRSVVGMDETSANDARADPWSAVASAEAETRRVPR